jgi:hypothetical protein
VDAARFSFVVAGHTYGAHQGSNRGLYPRFLAALGRQEGVDFLVLTGDFVREPDEEHFAAVTGELDALGIPAYLVLGNHDDGPRGRALLETRFGGTFYSFSLGSHLFVVLDSQRRPGSFDGEQRAFLDRRLGERDWKSAFVFVHEVLWLGHEDYAGLDANFGDDPAYRQTGFWSGLFPVLESHPGVEIFLVAGDVGGRPGAVPAFFDRVGNVSLVASGMGEVEDENLLRVDVDPGGATLTAVPLWDRKPPRPVEWYNPYNLRHRLPGQCLHPGCVLPPEGGADTGAPEPGLWERLMTALGLR